MFFNKQAKKGITVLREVIDPTLHGKIGFQLYNGFEKDYVWHAEITYTIYIYNIPYIIYVYIIGMCVYIVYKIYMCMYIYEQMLHIYKIEKL